MGGGGDSPLHTPPHSFFRFSEWVKGLGGGAQEPRSPCLPLHSGSSHLLCSSSLVLVACYVRVKQRNRDTSPLWSHSSAPLWPSPTLGTSGFPGLLALAPGRKPLVEGGWMPFFRKK